MSPTAIFFFSVVVSLVLFSHIARWYVMPPLRRIPLERALPPLLLFHCFRYIGLAFLIPGVVSPSLPAGFARPAAYGDLLSGALAYLALLAVRHRWRLATPLVWLFNVVGTLDLVNAFVQGARHHIQPDQLGVMYFIPTLRVPSIYVTHFMIFALLLRRSPQPAPGTSGPPPAT